MSTDEVIVGIMKSMIDNGKLTAERFESMDDYLAFVCATYKKLHKTVMYPNE